MLKKIYLLAQNIKYQIQKIFSSGIKIFVSIVVMNFILFLYLANINVLQFWNPFKFLLSIPKDERKEYTVYLPKENQEKWELIPIKKKRLKIKQDENNHTDLEKSILSVLQDIQRNTKNFLVKPIIVNFKIFKKVWVLDEKLILHLNKKYWFEESEKNRMLFKESVEKTIFENFTSIKRLLWTM